MSIMTSRTELHFGLVKWILRYLQGTSKCGITFSSATDLQFPGNLKNKLHRPQAPQKQIAWFRLI